MDENQVQAPDNNTVEPPVQQKMLPQDEVNKIVAREKARAGESARREAEEKYQRDLESLNAQRVQQDQRNAEVPRDVDINAIYQQLQEKINQDRMKQQMNEIAGSYHQHMDKARSSYDDFDEVTKPFDAAQFPQIVFLSAGMPNVGDMMYDLSKNPMKLASLNLLAERSPDFARNELLKLSKSIADNRQAQTDAQSQNISEPLDRLQSSRVANNNGKTSIRDLRNQPWLRG